MIMFDPQKIIGQFTSLNSSKPYFLSPSLVPNSPSPSPSLARTDRPYAGRRVIPAMDPRRISHAAIRPKVRQVGFVPRNAPPEPPARSRSYPAEPTSSPPLSNSPAGGSLSPVMIPPPRHLSDNLPAFRTPAVPVPEPARRRAGHSPVVGSYDPAESLLGTSSPAPSPPSSGRLIGDGEFSEESWLRRSNSAKFASSFPGGGFDLTAVNAVSAADLASNANGKKAVATDANAKKTTGEFWFPVFQLMRYFVFNFCVL